MLLLILILSDADNEILYAIYTKNKRRLLRVAKSYMGDRAEDVIHDVFISLAEKFENGIEKLCDKQDYYFVTIVKNRSIDILRRESNAEVITIDEDEFVFIDDSNQPDKHVLNQDDIERMMQYLDALKPKYREILEYKYLLGYANHEIAEQLGISVSVVSTRTQRALAQLRERFEKEG